MAGAARLVNSLDALCGRSGRAAARWWAPRAAAAGVAGAEHCKCVAAGAGAGAGVELRAAEDLPKASVALSVPAAGWAPWSAEFSLQRCLADRSLLPEAASARLAALASSSHRRAAELAALALHVAAERRDGRQAVEAFDRGEGAAPPTEAQAYALGLPDDPDVPLVWGQEQLNELSGTAAARAIARQRAVIAALHRDIDGEGGDLSCGSEVGHAAPISFAAFAHAVACIESRATAVPGRQLTLLPVAEYANHSHSPTCELVLNAASEGGGSDDGSGGAGLGAATYELRTLGDVAEGDALTIAYADTADGAQSNASRMLRMYGFADETSCRTDALPALVSLLTPEVATNTQEGSSSAGAADAAAGESSAAVLLAALRAAKFEPGGEPCEVGLTDLAEAGSSNVDGAPALLAVQADSRLMQWARLLCMTDYELELLGERMAAKMGDNFEGPGDSGSAGDYVADALRKGPVSLPSEVEALRLAGVTAAAAATALLEHPASQAVPEECAPWARSVRVVRRAEAAVLQQVAAVMGAKADMLEARLPPSS